MWIVWGALTAVAGALAALSILRFAEVMLYGGGTGKPFVSLAVGLAFGWFAYRNYRRFRLARRPKGQEAAAPASNE